MDEWLRPEFRSDLYYMPTLHPAFILREPWHLPFYKLDWLRAVRQDPTDWEWGPRYFDDADQLVRMHSEAAIIGVDVENGGDGHPMTDPLLCIGVGTADYSVTVRWPIRNPRVKYELFSLLASSIPKVLQNINHDRLTLHAQDVEFRGPFHDTLPRGCIIASKAWHDLGTMHNWYKFAPRWKTRFHSGDDKKGAKIFSSKPYMELASYNGCDCMGTVHVFEGQQNE